MSLKILRALLTVTGNGNMTLSSHWTLALILTNDRTSKELPVFLGGMREYFTSFTETSCVVGFPN